MTSLIIITPALLLSPFQIDNKSDPKPVAWSELLQLWLVGSLLSTFLPSLSISRWFIWTMGDTKRSGTSTPVNRTMTRSSSGRQTGDTRGSAGSVKGDDFGADPPMLEAKLNRKRAEGDLQLLANRYNFSNLSRQLVSIKLCNDSILISVTHRLGLLCCALKNRKQWGR